MIREIESLEDSIVEGIAARFAEPAPFAALRWKAAEAYRRSPSPSRVTHLWRYTDPAALLPPQDAMEALASLSPERESAKAPCLPDELRSALAAREIAGAAALDGTGAFRAELLPELREKGVRLAGLRVATAEGMDVARTHLGSIVGGTPTSEGHGKLEALNLALWSAGTVIHVPRGVRVEKPIHVWLRPALPFQATRLLVVLEEDSELTVIEEFEGGGEGTFLNSVAELSAGPGARLRHVAVQRLGSGVRHHAAQRSSGERDSVLNTTIASLGGGLVKADFGSILRGSGASVELVGFLYGEGKSQFDHHTLHDHRADHTYSNLDFKVVLKDRARSAYTGLIRIEPEAPESEAYQENRNLLLNEGAKAESIPELEILTDAVRCTHGATVGTLDPSHIFYLRSRGLSRREAVRLIVSGFIEPTLTRLPADLADRLRRHVEDRLDAI